MSQTRIQNYYLERLNLKGQLEFLPKSDALSILHSEVPKLYLPIPLLIDKFGKYYIPSDSNGCNYSMSKKVIAGNNFNDRWGSLTDKVCGISRGENDTLIIIWSSLVHSSNRNTDKKVERWISEIEFSNVHVIYINIDLAKDQIDCEF